MTSKMKLTALTPIKIDGHRVGVGETFETDEKQAESLLAGGHAEHSADSGKDHAHASAAGKKAAGKS